VFSSANPRTRARSGPERLDPGRARRLPEIGNRQMGSAHSGGEAQGRKL